MVSRSLLISGVLRSVEDTVQTIDSTGPPRRVFLSFGGPPRAMGHSLTVAVRRAAWDHVRRFRAARVSKLMFTGLAMSAVLAAADSSHPSGNRITPPTLNS